MRTAITACGPELQWGFVTDDIGQRFSLLGIPKVLDSETKR
jgi:hypothetical protein